MMDPIGVKPTLVPCGKLDQREAVKVVPLQAATRPQTAVMAETGAREAARAMAARPPVDQDRVQQIKKALQEGRYPLVPAKIADQLIAAQMRWAEKR